MKLGWIYQWNVWKQVQYQKLLTCIYDVIKEIIHRVKGDVYIVLCPQQAHFWLEHLSAKISNRI